MVEEWKERVAVIERDVRSNTQILNKVNETLDKTADALSAIKTLLTQHEERIKFMDQGGRSRILEEDRLFDKVFDRIEKNDDEIKKLVEKNDSEFKRVMGTLDGKIDEAIEKINTKIGRLDRIRWIAFGAFGVIIMIASHFQWIPNFL